MIPRIAMFNNIAGFGRCSTTVSLPVLSAMKVQVCPVPTSVLSNHLAFPVCYKTELTEHLKGYLGAWKELDVTFDGAYCGFLGNSEQLQIVKEFLEDFQPNFFLLDPTMGDHGHFYSSIKQEYCQALCSLLPYADLITPNLTEACLMTDTPWKENTSGVSDEWTDTELTFLCEKLSALCPGNIIITGIPREGNYLNFIWEKGKTSTYSTPDAGDGQPGHCSYHGTGDLFSAILAADALHGIDLTTSVQKAADFVARCIRGTLEAGTPEPEGLLLEKYLYELM